MNDSNKSQAAMELWERVKTIYMASQQTEEQKSQVDRYLSMVTKVERDGDSFTMFTTNSAAAELLNTAYAEKIASLMSLFFGISGAKVKFTLDEARKAAIIIPPEEKRAAVPAAKVEGVSGATRRVSHSSTMPLRKEYTFDEFVEGPSNSWAYSAAKGVVAHPGEKGYNPLFIHGGTGLGKTHLMQAIGNELIKTHPNLSVCYLTAEMFLNEYVNYMQNARHSEFREKYRNFDVLLIDDVQFFQKGKVVQEEFFNTFNYLQDKSRQIVMTCDVSPKNLPALEERLISRFIGGMVQEIESPSYETRLAILKKKTENTLPLVPDSTLEFIADKIKSHVRAMEGALAKVKVILANNPATALSPLVLTHLLKDFIDNEQTMKKMTILEIQTAVARKFNVDLSQINSTERTQSLVTPRQVAMFISRKYTANSLEEIGKAFEKKHATILHGVKTIQQRLETESELKETVEQILAEFGVKLD